MHSDRTAAPIRRVTGLGAPLSVELRLPQTDVPLLRSEVLRHLERHEQRRPSIATDRGADLERWEAEHRTWQEMLHGLDGGEPVIELLWPTAYTAPVLRGAINAARREVEAASPDAPTPQALAALESARAILDAFLAVDNGGLQDLDL